MGELSKTFFRASIATHTAIYRFTGGRFVGGSEDDGGVVLLETTGAKTGKVRTVPIMHLNHDDGMIVVASAGGADAHPGWYHNLKADPEVTVQVGKRRAGYRARTSEGDERTALWDRVVAHDRRFVKYTARTTRQIPVVVLTPSSP